MPDGDPTIDIRHSVFLGSIEAVVVSTTESNKQVLAAASTSTTTGLRGRNGLGSARASR